MVDTAGNVLTNTAHEYVECSNKGYCNRDLGVCSCLGGYSGTACQRMDCPSVSGIACAGHGTCETARTLAKIDHDNLYELWDADMTQGCLCDSGYSGADCSFRTCKIGYDTFYQDPESSWRFSNWSIIIATQNSITSINGNYSLIFNDYNGHAWHTDPISYDASCLTVIKALEELPNNVIPFGSVRCSKWSQYHNIPATDEPIYHLRNPYYGIKYTLAFPLNPGILKPPSLNYYLDGHRPTLFTNEATSTLSTFVYANGWTGETTEYFTEKCVGVEVTIATEGAVPLASTYDYLASLTSMEIRLLSQCLGDSDGLASYSAAGTIESSSYTWDYGTIEHPHVIRLVERTSSPVTDLCNRTADESTSIGNSNPLLDGGRSGNMGRTCQVDKPSGFICALYYDATTSRFRLMNRPGVDFGSTTTFAIFTTLGTAHIVSYEAKVYTLASAPYSNTIYTTNATSNYVANGYVGNIDCETNNPNINGALECLEKEDRVFFLDPFWESNNPQYLNIYTVKKLYVAPRTKCYNCYGGANVQDDRVRIVLDSAFTSEWLFGATGVKGRAYLFRPPDRGYTYVSPCSNRGECSHETGLCSCYATFIGDDCSIMHNLPL